MTVSVGDVSATAELTVVPAALAELVVSPATARITAGESREFSVEGLDRFGNSLGAQSATYSMSGGGTCEGAVCSATRAGTHTVTAAVGDLTAIATVDVVPGAPRELVLTQPSARVRAGDRVQIPAQVRDEFGNVVTDAAPVAYVMSAGGSCSASGCRATRAGEYRVTVTTGDLSATVRVRVVAAELDRIVLAPRRARVPVGTWQAFTPRGFDRFGNRTPAGQLTGARLAIGPAAGKAGSGRCDGLRCRATDPGRYLVTVSVDGLTAAARLVVVRARGR